MSKETIAVIAYSFFTIFLIGIGIGFLYDNQTMNGLLMFILTSLYQIEYNTRKRK